MAVRDKLNLAGFVKFSYDGQFIKKMLAAVHGHMNDLTSYGSSFYVAVQNTENDKIFSYRQSESAEFLVNSIAQYRLLKDPNGNIVDTEFQGAYWQERIDNGMIELYEFEDMVSSPSYDGSFYVAMNYNFNGAQQDRVISVKLVK